jgi:structure-specific endonuclease subunit SLX1
VTGWFVYVLWSPARRRSYVGITSDPPRRLRQHNGEVRGGARATRGGRPWSVAALHGPYPTRSQALRVELDLKRRRGLDARLAFRPTVTAVAIAASTPAS